MAKAATSAANPPTTTNRTPAAHVPPKRRSISAAATVSTTTPAATTSPRSEVGLRRAATSHPRVDDRLLAGVVVEALARLAAVPAGGEHLAQGRRLGEAPLVELGPHHVADRTERVEADEVGERERAHRMGGAGLHRRVDLVDGADALLVGADRVEHVGHEQTVDDEAGLVLGRDRQLALGAREAEAGFERLVGRGDAPDDLDELHDLGRVEVVQAEEPFGS